MKRLLRSRLMQGLLARLVAAYGELIIATLRWRLVDFDAARTALAAPEGLIALFWHGRISVAMACRPLLGAKPRRVMISLSRDGEFIAMAAERIGIPTVRGSTGRGEARLAKGGAAAFRQAVRFLADGGAMLLTPDGPRGPDQVMQPGPIQLARAARAPVFLMGLAARPALSPKSWDRARLPLPFARACLVIDGPLHVPGGGDASLETVRLDWEGRLRAAQIRAEASLSP